MLRRTPIYTAVDPALVASGIYDDVQQVMRPLWTQGQNVQFVDGKVRHRNRDTKLLQPGSGRSRGMGQQLLSNGEKVLWLEMEGSILRWDQFSMGEITTIPASGLNSPYIDFTFYGDWVFINRGIGNVQFWNGVTLSTVTEMPTNVRQLQKFLSFLMAVGVGSKKTGVQWSDANDVSKWTPTTTNSAGALYFDDFNGGIVASSMLGPVLAVYGDSQMGVVSFIGSPFQFGKKTMLTGIGCTGPEAVTAVGMTNYGMGRQGPWRTDGQDYQYIDAGKMHQYFQLNVNWEVASKIIVARNDVQRTVEFYLPTGSSTELNEAWSFDPASQGWSSIPVASYFSEDMLFGLPLVANDVGEVLRVGGKPFSKEDLYLLTKPMLMQVQSQNGITDVHFETKVDEVELLLREVHNVRMRIGSSVESTGTISWSPYILLDPDHSTYLVPAGIPDAPYWWLEFSSAVQNVNVVEAGVGVVEDGVQVVALAEADSWRFNLQGFLLFGVIQGVKPA